MKKRSAGPSGLPDDMKRRPNLADDGALAVTRGPLRNATALTLDCGHLPGPDLPARIARNSYRSPSLRGVVRPIRPSQCRPRGSSKQWVPPCGLFVPKPSCSVRCQRCGMPELGTIVRRCPLASAAGDGRRYSLGYSVPRWLLLDHLDANYWRVPVGVQSVQLAVCGDVRSAGLDLLHGLTLTSGGRQASPRLQSSGCSPAADTADQHYP